jgi:hypothetical protein
MNEETKALLDEIHKGLDSIDEHMAWLIRPESRFRVGQRVEWSRKGRRNGFPSRKCAQRGTVLAISGFCVLVKLDGLKQEKEYHHGFFNPVVGEKIF